MSEHTTSSSIPRAARHVTARTRAESGLVGLLGGGAAGILLAEMVTIFLSSPFGENGPTVLFVALPVICALLCAAGAATLPYHRTGGR